MDISLEKKRFVLEDFSFGFISFCGMKAVAAGPGYMESEVRIEKQHLQQDGFVHAGLMATMADHTAGYAAYTLAPEDHRILTIEFKINLMRPAIGDYLVCRARVVKPGKRVSVCESEVYDRRPGGEILVAKAQLTMALVPGSDINDGNGESSSP